MCMIKKRADDLGQSATVISAKHDFAPKLLEVTQDPCLELKDLCATRLQPLPEPILLVFNGIDKELQLINLFVEV